MAFTLAGFIGDGAIEFEEAGMTDGAPVSGTVTGKFIQIAPVEI